MTIPTYVCAAALALPMACAAQSHPSVTTERLTDGVYLFRAPAAMDLWTATNSVAVINDQDVTVFDSNTRPGTARAIIAQIRKLTDKPVRTLINSHWHMDHWSGNDEYAKAFPGIQIISTTETRAYMSRMGPAFFVDEIRGSIKPGPDSGATERFANEIAAVPRVLPTLAFRDSLYLWSGRREFRLFSATGDATGCAVLYLPKERILVTGDVLVSPEDGAGPPPWTTNSYAITPWLASLRGFEALNVDVIVPGQGPAMHDKTYLSRTVRLYARIIAQVHAALERGAVTGAQVQSAVNVDSIGLEYTPRASAPSPHFHHWVATLTQKVFQEAVDGAGTP